MIGCCGANTLKLRDKIHVYRKLLPGGGWKKAVGDIWMLYHAHYCFMHIKQV